MKNQNPHNWKLCRGRPTVDNFKADILRLDKKGSSSAEIISYIERRYKWKSEPVSFCKSSIQRLILNAKKKPKLKRSTIMQTSWKSQALSAALK